MNMRKVTQRSGQFAKRTWHSLLNKFRSNKIYHRFILNQFNKIFWDPYTHPKDTRWLGVPTLMCPLDLWIIQEIIFEHQPDVIIECGTYQGGTALYLASICDLIRHGRVISIDILNGETTFRHPRITYQYGSSTSKTTVSMVVESINKDDQVMVILDSDYHKNHILKELNIYGKLVTKGQYLIVSGTHLNGHPLWRDFGPGPMEAIEEFMETTDQFIADRNKEKFVLTFNPNGYLKKVDHPRA